LFPLGTEIKGPEDPQDQSFGQDDCQEAQVGELLEEQ
jgi:hypothetical protein